MAYPVWDAPGGYGLWMAGFAVLHVFVSHFAIGGGLYLVIAERSARRAGDGARLEFVKGLSRFFALATLVFGALTGVGIWFVIGLLNPSATSALIHNFVWAWAIEWTFFFVEIIAALLYYYGWERMSARAHMQLGWTYFAAAFLSLVVINGIITFMLTPGRWIRTGAFWDGFFNPTYAPSLVLRTGVCLLLAGLFALFLSSRLPAGRLKVRLARGQILWALAGLAVAGASWFWYRGAIPGPILAHVGTGLPIPQAARTVLLVSACVLLLALLALYPLSRALSPVAGAALLLAALAAFGGFEWWRESMRKPFVIYGYMYGNGIRVDRIARLKNEGLLRNAAFRTGNDGADIFRFACRACHTIDRYNPVHSAFDGTDERFVLGSIRGLHKMRSRMAPFPGTDAEAKALASWIWARVDQRPFTEVYPLKGEALGAKAYEVRCGRCHDARAQEQSFKGLGKDDLEVLLSTELTPEMPVYSGSGEEKEALVQYLLQLGKGGARQ